MQAKGNKKQMPTKKSPDWTFAFLQNFRIFWCFFVVKKSFLDALYLYFLFFLNCKFVLMAYLFQLKSVM